MPKVAKFHFTHSKLKKRPFFAENLTGKFKIPGGLGSPSPLPTPMRSLKLNAFYSSA